MKKLSRLQLDLSERAITQIDGIKKDLDLSSRAAAVRYMINLMSLLIEEIKKGGAIVTKDGSKLIIPLLDVTDKD